MPSGTALSRLDLSFEIKAVDAAQRIVEGYCAIFGVPDLGNDVIEPGAFDSTLSLRPLTDVKVFIGHHGEDIPVGYPVEIRADQRGLYTRTKVLSTTAGDDLLKAAAELQAAGAPLGMSIGYRAEDYSIDPMPGGQMMRRLKQLYLGEYSYVGMPMHPMAGVTAVKSQDTDETLTGAALTLKTASGTLDQLAAQAVLDQKAMAQLGLDTKDGAAIRPALAEQIKSVTDQLIAMFQVNPETGEDLTLTEGAKTTDDAPAADDEHKAAAEDLEAYHYRLELL